MDAEINSIIQQMTHDRLTATLETHTRFYVDIEWLIDFRLTALLALASAQEHEIIHKNMASYNNRVYPGTVMHFPGVSVLEEQIDEFIATKLNTPEGAYFTQPVDYFEMFPALLYDYIQNNPLFGISEPLLVTLAWQGYSVHPQIRDKVIAQFNKFGSKLTLRNMAGGLEDLTPDQIAEHTHFSISDFQKAVTTESFLKALCDLKIPGAAVTTAPQITRPLDGRTEEEVFKETHKYFSAFFDFSYLTREVPYV